MSLVLGDGLSCTNWTDLWQVWPHTGLELRANHRDGDAHERLATASYFLHHPDLSSEMIAPEGVSRGLFEGLRCEVDYQFGRAKKPTSAKGRGQRKASLGKQAVGEKKTGHSHERRSGNHPSQLRDKPRRSKKAVEAEGLVDNGASGEASTPASQHHTGNDTVKEEDLEVLVMESISDMASLLEFAFRKLVGLKGAATGYRTLKNTVSVSLIELAPAVWNLQYLQVSSPRGIQTSGGITDHVFRPCLSMLEPYLQYHQGLRGFATPSQAHCEQI